MLCGVALSCQSRPNTAPGPCISRVWTRMMDSSPPLFSGDPFQDPYWVPETEDSTQPCMYYV